jgi:hypothetical protein
MAQTKVSAGNQTNGDLKLPSVNGLPAQSGEFTVKTADGRCTISINADRAPELKDWAETNLAPVLAEWYPRIATILASDGYTPPDHFRITLKPMDGVAGTVGQEVAANSTWLAQEIHGEAVGSLVHETVHVVQQFNGQNPGWLVEGSADYIRWFLYEPQSHGADIVWMRKQSRHFAPHYNDGYRVTANFLNWVTVTCDADIVTRMNAAMRQNRYSEKLWKQYTGKTLGELSEEWRANVMTQIAGKGT